LSKILLIDGNSILNRGYYALPLLTDKNGIYTNAILGFLNIFLKVIEEEQPDYLTVAFDVKAPTFRHKMYEAYKGTRKPMPEELRMQLPIIREVLSSMGVRIVEQAGFEADDLLGTLAKKSEAMGMEVVLLSGDRDLLQIASDNIRISIPKTQGGKTETHNYYAKDVIAEYGVTPSEFIDVKALQGDTSDNIPGVAKVGPKTATDLISKYHNLEGVYEHLEEITAKALHKNLEEGRESAFMSRVLATIDTNSPVEPMPEISENKNLLNEASMEVFLKYSLRSIITKLESMDTENASVKEKSLEHINLKIIEDFDEANAVFSKISKAKNVGVFADKEAGIFVSFGKDDTTVIKEYGFLSYDYLREELIKSLDCAKSFSTCYIKKLYEYTDREFSNAVDIEILAYLDDPLKGDYPLTYISERYGDLFLGDEKTLQENKDNYNASLAAVSYIASAKLYNAVKDASMDRLYYDIELPLSFVLYSMEKEGVCVDKETLKEYGSALEKRILALEKEIYAQAGCEFNINSPKQLGEILFEKLGLPGGKKNKSGYSTAADVLEKLKTEHPVVNSILEYRTLSKLKSTYADGLANYITGDGRIHTHFNQTITATGRISSTEPNLQNIPIRTELGRELRKVFYPREGFTFVDADYSQIELRLMAHMSGDEALISAFNEGRDVHRSTAAKVFKVPYDSVTDIQRRNAKAVNFGIIYGISAFGLSQDIGVSISEAKQYINEYFETFPGVKAYLDDTVENAKKDGFTKTLYGRIRPIPELKSSNFMQRSFGERVAMNAPIQGTAADIMKIAMIRIFNRIKAERLNSRMLIQVHDEVLVETDINELEAVERLLSEEMENAAKMSVKLLSDVNHGSNWYEAH